MWKYRLATILQGIVVLLMVLVVFTIAFLPADFIVGVLTGR